MARAAIALVAPPALMACMMRSRRSRLRGAGMVTFYYSQSPTGLSFRKPPLERPGISAGPFLFVSVGRVMRRLAQRHRQHHEGDGQDAKNDEETDEIRLDDDKLLVPRHCERVLLRPLDGYSGLLVSRGRRTNTLALRRAT